MFELVHRYDIISSARGARYRPSVYAEPDVDGRWSAWIVFFPVSGGPPVATDRETTQSAYPALVDWAASLTATYLEGALDRALNLEPSLATSRLAGLERLQDEALTQAETFERAAALARDVADVAAERITRAAKKK